eukprot:gb/GECH01007491.1/.p1 GENE.gb/GECH01007491.1/~~gb/GECH01007491.1/.p1  ORF type:complete len:212 (+),score=51.54 gb/GECH01007491.1/:1-636(+)
MDRAKNDPELIWFFSSTYQQIRENYSKFESIIQKWSRAHDRLCDALSSYTSLLEQRNDTINREIDDNQSLEAEIDIAFVTTIEKRYSSFKKEIKKLNEMFEKLEKLLIDSKLLVKECTPISNLTYRGPFSCQCSASDIIHFMTQYIKMLQEELLLAKQILDSINEQTPAHILLTYQTILGCRPTIDKNITDEIKEKLKVDDKMQNKLGIIL